MSETSGTTEGLRDLEGVEGLRSPEVSGDLGGTDLFAREGAITGDKASFFSQEDEPPEGHERSFFGQGDEPPDGEDGVQGLTSRDGSFFGQGDEPPDGEDGVQGLTSRDGSFFGEESPEGDGDIEFSSMGSLLSAEDPEVDPEGFFGAGAFGAEEPPDEEGSFAAMDGFG